MVIVHSATKGLAAMTLALAHSRGWLDYEERVCAYWPEFAQRGKEMFSKVGCALCHNPSFQTPGTANPTTESEEIGPHSVALRGQTVNLYSDLLVHRMGATLADNVIQGNAGPDEFRTTPLWGLGQRLFFLHDGRTSDLREAIQAHRSGSFFTFNASEANGVIKNFNALQDNQKQDVLNFLRSL